MKTKKIFYIIYFLIFIVIGFINYINPLNFWFRLIYTIVTMLLLIRCEMIFEIKPAKHLISICILLVGTYVSQNLLANLLEFEGHNIPGNNAFVFETALSLFAIYKLLSLK